MDNIFHVDNFKKENIVISESELGKLVKYKELLIEWNKNINLTSIIEDKEVFYKHFVDSLLLLSIPQVALEGKTIIDIGTGAGFPGLPLAITNKDLSVTLSDSLKKRIKFLEHVATELKLTNVEVLDGRAEDLGQKPEYRESFDIAVARAVSKLPVLLEYTLPFVKEGGLFIAYKGPDYIEELEESKTALEELGGELLLVKNFKIQEMEIERTIIIFTKHKKTPDKYPRRAGVPLKKPL